MIQIIGGAGFVGTRLAEVLSASDQPYQIFDRALSGNQFVDVTIPDSFRNLPPADVVINLAAEHRDDVSPRSLYDLVNVEGARNVCNYCRVASIHTIVFTSSVAVYGFAPEGTDERGIYNPFNDYGRTKMEAEAIYSSWLAEDPGKRSLVIVRPTVIFGEQNRGNVHNLFRQIATGRFVMFGMGTNRKSMAYVLNIAEFLAFSVRFGPGKHLYNYVDKPDLDMTTLVAHCRSVLFKKKGAGLRVPGWVGILAGYCFDALAAITGKKLPISSIRVKKFMNTTAFNTSISKSGFKPTCTLEEGIERTLRYEFLEKH
ncbi:MAG: UDP-N-acetylglucosamine 4-epimerase [Rhodobacteraceae bacterium]|nr:UDP-N-acetylglucosamine 4-epimerase [Paracoccaceae bacterium]|tara:strand:+ start:542 stop:1483 length:942 start_codon:yes stop_codon:yes gene_type:complete